MFNGKIVITHHAKERYAQRKIDFNNKKDNLCKKMLEELRPLNVKRMIKAEDGSTHVFTKFNNKFVIIENPTTGEYVVKTVIRLNTRKRNRMIEKLVS